MENYLVQRFNMCAKGLNQRLQNAVMKIPDRIKEEIQEIHIRTNKPVTLYSANITYYLTSDNQIVSHWYNSNMLIATPSDICETFQNICCYSVYSKQAEINNGFITLKGGHRAGICGTAVYNDGKITSIRDISSINLRIAKEFKGASAKLLSSIDINKGGVLICGIPSCGKTTMLRDIARVLSTDYSLKVCVVDERGELGGAYQGISQNDLGLCDVLDGYRKPDGIMQAVRSLSPDVIVCDEIGTDDEAEKITECLNSGVSVIASVHCSNPDELLSKPQTCKLISTGAFEYIVFLSDRKSPGVIKELYQLEELKNYEDNRLYSADIINNGCRVLSANIAKTENSVI
ncbi:MAG: ATPase, T2SS/T4P/T4SS family [Acutalibacteraceae bacterium]|nr:ATPase, T2SS/T4P/T4SS family [Acutalibacteraceae bacterium]